MNVPLFPSSMRKVAVFRALQLGDLLCSIPALRAFRKQYPKTQITLIGLPHMENFAKRFSDYIDSFIPFPGYIGLPEQRYDPFAFDDFLKKMNDENFDLILQMQGNGSIVNDMLKQCGAKFIAGFHTEKYIEIKNPGFFIPYPNDRHEVYRHLSLMDHLGISADGDELEFRVEKEDEEELNELNLPIANGNYICLHPGSRGAWRQWPHLFFASIGDYCVRKGYQVVITGTSEERGIALQVEALMHEEAIISAGKTSLGAVAALLKGAAVLVSNCTGVSHLAAALKTPSVIISMDGEPDRWAPLDKQLHRTIDWTGTPNYSLVIRELEGLFEHQAKALPPLS